MTTAARHSHSSFEARDACEECRAAMAARWPVDEVLAEVGAELRKAVAKFGPMAGPHEGYAVILEELDELWADVKGNAGRGPDARAEAIQIAAMAVRYVLDVSR